VTGAPTGEASQGRSRLGDIPYEECAGTATGVAGLLAAAVDELTDDSALSDETYQALAAEFTERQLISLVFLVGTYSLLSMAFSTFQMELDPGLDPEDFDTLLANQAPSKKGT
jgi:hypothetical protein